MTSMAHAKGRIRFDDMQAEHGYDPWAAYAQSKLANLLFALELDWRTRGRQCLCSAWPPTQAFQRRTCKAQARDSATPACRPARSCRSSASSDNPRPAPPCRSCTPPPRPTSPTVGFTALVSQEESAAPPSRSARHHLHATSPPADSCGKCPGSSPTWRIPPSSHRLLDHAPPQPDEKTGRVPTEGEPGRCQPLMSCTADWRRLQAAKPASGSGRPGRAAGEELARSTVRARKNGDLF